jgi:hypothetical protein
MNHWNRLASYVCLTGVGAMIGYGVAHHQQMFFLFLIPAFLGIMFTSDGKEW